MQKISIDPITRLEGHGKIDIFLDDEGNVANAYLLIPELRGFEKFAEGRPVEEMPRITQRICGVCPEAHHMAAAKAADAVYHVEPPPAGKKLRELLYSAFYVADHIDPLLHPGRPRLCRGARRAGRRAQHPGRDPQGRPGDRRQGHPVPRAWPWTSSARLGGKTIHPVCAIPGGMSKAINEEERAQFEAIAREEVEFALFTLQLFRDIVLGNKAYVDMILSDAFTMPTYYMGLVDENNKVNFYDGKVRVVDPAGQGVRQVRPERVPGRHRRARRALDLSQVPLPEEGGLEGIGHRQGQRRVPGHAPVAAQRRRRHGHAASPGSLRRDVQDAGRQAGAPYPGHALGAAASSCCMPPSGCWSWRPTRRSPARTCAPSPPPSRTRAWASSKRRAAR